MPGETGSQDLPEDLWNSWKGRAASASILRWVVSVYDALRSMLGAAAPDQIFTRGQGWSSIMSGDAPQGSRLEQVVARLCRCGVTIVMQARRYDGPRESHVYEGVKR